MIKVILEVNGMKCGMCEAHVNDLVRKVPGVKKVSSSHIKKETEIICENDVDIDSLISAISKDGYKALNPKIEPYTKKSLFAKLFRK
jgi:copper chaperone CopZ